MTSSSFLQAFEKSCAHAATLPAFVFAEGMVTYAELAARVESVRRYVRDHMPADETLVAVLATQELDTYASILALLAEGRAYVPLNPAAPPDRNLDCIHQAAVHTLLCSSGTPATQAWSSDSRNGLHVVETRSLADAGPLQPIKGVEQNQLAYLLFTSGSTGRPKGVPIFHRNVNAFLAAFVDGCDFDFTASDRFLQMFDLTFDLSIMSFLVPLTVGACCHLVPADGPGFLAVVRTLQRGHVTVALMVPSVLAFLERYFDEIRLPDVRLSLFCGEALPERLAHAWSHCVPNARILNVYGPTEATIFCSSHELLRAQRETDAYQGVVSIGSPLNGTGFVVVDDRMLEVSLGEKGELIIVGDQVTDSYWRDEEKSRNAFIPIADGRRGYRTGDVAFCQQGLYYYCGRADFQLKVDGYRVESGEVEHHARQFAGVRDAVLIGKPATNGVTELHLFVLTDSEPEPPMPKRCEEFLAGRLPKYMVPARVHVRATFPLNANGKVDRKALLAGIEVPGQSP